MRQPNLQPQSLYSMNNTELHLGKGRVYLPKRFLALDKGKTRPYQPNYLQTRLLAASLLSDM
jgi:hypothetical protein